MTTNGTDFQKPSFKQLGSLAGFIVEFLASILSFEQVAYWLGHKSEFKKKLLEVFSVEEVFDLWSEEKTKITNFYRTCFGDKWILNWGEVKFPEVNGNIKRPEFIFPNMTEQEAFDAYADHFGKDKVWKAWNNITEAIKRESVQKRPTQNYIVLHIGGDEPDLLNYSYDDGIAKNIIFLTPLEGIIAAFRYRFETGKMYDVIRLTRLSALDQDGGAMSMCRGSDSGFHVGSNDRGSRHSDRGLRQASF